MFVYRGTTPTLTTSGSTNAEVDVAFIKPGATRRASLISFLLGGRNAAATTISSVTARIRKWTASASSGGTAVVLTAGDPGIGAVVATAGQATAGVTPGTTASVTLLTVSAGQSGGNGWMKEKDDAGITLEGGDNKSIDFFTLSGAASVPHELSFAVEE